MMCQEELLVSRLLDNLPAASVFKNLKTNEVCHLIGRTFVLTLCFPVSIRRWIQTRTQYGTKHIHLQPFVYHHTSSCDYEVGVVLVSFNSTYFSGTRKHFIV